MPTAKSAAPNQPTSHTSSFRPAPRRSRLRRLAVVGLGLLAGVAMVLPAQTILAPDAAASAGPACPGYSSTTNPPDYIRVLRHKSGRIDRVPFKRYVLVVLGREWPGYLPQQAINAGAVAVKQYAWYHAVLGGRATRSGQCFDVTDGTGDQLYTPNRTRIRQDHYTALAATWGTRLDKSGSLFMTGYRTGIPGACGSDATGWKLYARSATRCAYRGDGFAQILQIYYGPVAVVNGPGSGGGTATVETQSEVIPFSPLQINTTSSEAPATADAPPTADAPATADAPPTATADETGGSGDDVAQIGERPFTTA